MEFCLSRKMVEISCNIKYIKIKIIYIFFSCQINTVITSDSNYTVDKDKVDSKYCNDVD